jgi:hypothetical protein
MKRIGIPFGSRERELCELNEGNIKTTIIPGIGQDFGNSKANIQIDSMKLGW